MSTIYSKPNTIFYSELVNAPTGEVGTLGVTILKQSDASVILPRSTAGIVELKPKLYQATRTAPVTVGGYIVLWDNGSTNTADTLIVTNDIPVIVEPEFDVTTPVGKVRLLVADTGGEDGQTFLFSDLEIEAFLSLESQDIYCAAATALRSIAGNEVQVQKVTTALELETDGSKGAKALLELAKTYDEKSDEGYSFEVVPMGVDIFSRRQLRSDRLQNLEPGYGGAETE